MDNQAIETVQQNQTTPGRIEVTMPERPSRPMFELEKKDNIFAISAIVLSVLLSVFGIFGGFALGYSISIIMFILAFALYLIKCNRVRLFPLLCLVLALGNAVILITTTNGSVKFFGVIISFILFLVGTFGLTQDETIGNRATMGIFYSALSTIGNIGVSVKSLLSGSDGQKKSIGKAMLGVLCAVPVLVIVVPLLLKSDDAFSGMMNSIFNNSGNGFLTVFKSLFGLLISLFVIAYGFSLKTGRFLTTKQTKQIGIDNVFMVSFLSAIATCYLLYLFSQLAYFFSAFNGFLPNQEITYSQYARKGFFEMCIIAVINLGVVFLSILLAKKQNGKVSIGIRTVATFIAVFTLVIIATAISKMVLYINSYGMTVLRLTTSAFMLFLAILFLSVILRIYLNNINIVKTAFVVAGIIVILLGGLNVNHICARYNYEAYKDNRLNSIDVEAMYNLGDEGIPYLVKLAGSKNKVIAKDAQHYLAKAYVEDYFEDMYFAEGFDTQALREHQKYKNFSYFSLPRSRAYNTLYSFLEKNPKFDQKCLAYRKNNESFFDTFK